MPIMTYKGLKIIRFDAAGVNLDDDPTFNYKLKVALNWPDYMRAKGVTGHNIIVVRGEYVEVLEEFMKTLHLREIPELVSIIITGPNNVVIEETKKES